MQIVRIPPGNIIYKTGREALIDQRYDRTSAPLGQFVYLGGFVNRKQPFSPLGQFLHIGGFVSRKQPFSSEARIGLSYAVEKELDRLFRLNFFY